MFADSHRNQNLTVVTSHYLGGPWLVSNSPTLLQSLGWLNSTLPVIFAHASFITASDFHSLRETNQYISTTPESELHYGHGHPFAELIQDQASLGVDTHFTFSPYMAWQARLWLQDLRIERYEDVIIDHKKIPVDNPMSTEQAFNLITRAGALALRRPDLGIIAAGAKADIVILDGESPNMLGWTDAVAAIILHSHVGDVEHVLVGGEWRKRDGKMVYPGYTEVKRRFLQSARRIQNIWKQKDWPSLDEGLYMNTTKWGHTEVIDTMAGNGTGY